DTGALAIGATLAACALTTGLVVLLPVAGLIFVAETLSVILQVGSFKLRGKRIFRMAPLHNQFEWPEVKVTIRFWLIGALAGIVARVRQVHGNTVVHLDRAVEPWPEGDAMWTDRTGVLLGIAAADCVPILLVDPSSGRIGAAHAGWQGTRLRVAQALVRALVG